MKPEQFARMKELMLALSDLSASERAALLDEACKEDPGLRREVEAILAHENEALALMATAEARPQAASAYSFTPGSMIGRYRLEEKIGQGGMGVVWKALDPSLRREVAIKLLPSEFTQDPTRRARLVQEAQLLAAVNHPNIATIYSLERTNGLHFITLEFIEGETLAERLGGGPLPFDEIVSTARQIASALEAAHKKGVIHRDLKPANIKITPEGLVKVLDFGIAKEIGGDNPDSDLMLMGGHTVLGTPGYMSPEQVLGQPADQRTDLWAFGCVIYECVSGQRAIRGNTPFECLTATIGQEPDCRALPEDTPDWLNGLITDCLRKDIDERLSTATEARRVIEEEITRRSFTDIIDRRGTKPAIAIPNNLPLQLTSLIGRQLEIREVRRLLRKHRLVMLTGAGGCGKSRLALEVAGRAQEASPDGIWVVELAPLMDGSLVPQTVAAALGIKDEPGRSPIESLIGFLGKQEALLVLDNCEHLVEGSAELVRTLLLSCPRLRVLATSRESLRLEGEVTYRVPSLELPNGERALTELREVESVQLFVDRASNANPAFSLAESNARSVAEICKHLDGMPLAIELAAARVKTMSVAEIASRLEDRFRLLTRGSRGALSRHQTLRALIDWSYALLKPGEQAMLRRLSVFAGGWTLAAAEEVCQGDGIEGWQVLDLLTGLVDKSLVEMEATGEQRTGRTRYRLLESLRQYARERLVEEKEDRAAQRRHLDFYLTLAEKAASQLDGPDQSAWLSRLDEEHDNLRAALEMCKGRDDDAGGAGMRLAGALGGFWQTRGYWLEGRTMCQELLARSNVLERSPIRARALSVAGTMVHLLGDCTGAQSFHQESLDIARELGDKCGIAGSLNNLGIVARDQGDYAAARSFGEESLTIRRELGDKHGIASSLCNLGNVASDQGDYAEARSLFEESLAISRELGHKHGISGSLNKLGTVAVHLGDYTGARSSYEKSLVIARELGDKQAVASSLNNLGIVASDQGDYASARSFYEESLAIQQELGDKRGAAISLGNLGNMAADRGDYASARHAYEECLAMFRELGNRHGASISLLNLGCLALAQGEYAQARALFEESLAMKRELGDKLGVVCSLNNLGSVNRSLGDHAAARSLFEESLAIARELGDKSAIAISLCNLGTVAMDYAEARSVYEESLAIAEAMGDKRTVALSLRKLGNATQNAGDYPAARSLLEKSLAVGHDVMDKRGIVDSLLGLGYLACSQGHFDRAGSLLSAAQALADEIGYKLSPWDQREIERQVAMLRAELGDSVFSQAWAAGQERDLDQTIEWALRG